MHWGLCMQYAAGWDRQGTTLTQQHLQQNQCLELGMCAPEQFHEPPIPPPQSLSPSSLDPVPLPQSLAPQLFAMSLFPYLAFLYFLTKSGKTPRLTLIGFYFLLAFVGATIPAGIYGRS